MKRHHCSPSPLVEGSDKLTFLVPDSSLPHENKSEAHSRLILGSQMVMSVMILGHEPVIFFVPSESHLPHFPRRWPP